LPTGAHPLMDPLSETMLWPHEFGEVYRLYDRIFDCRGHGWSNLQSVHLNLPFSSEDEFGRLHAAVRLLLPILPALSASTPLFDGAYTGFSDSRLEVYRKNQSRIPAIAGRVIPEAVFTRTAYDASIYAPIEAGIRPHDPAGILKSTFMNSRGAIARFDRNTIEIRIIDSQECPTAELAILAAVVAVARAMVEERWVSIEVQKAWEVEPLAGHFLRVIREGEAALLPDPAYLSIFGYPGERASAGQLWRHLIEAIRGDLEPVFVRPLGHILETGCLSTRIRRRLGDRPSPKAIRTVYEDLARCLAEDRLFA
jgi:carboxylate-amine ligase